MNVIDIFIIMVMISFIVVGAHRGVIKEAVSFVGIVIVFVASYILKDYLGNILCLNGPFFKFGGALEGMSSFNILMYQAISFLFVFAILLLIYIVLVKTSTIVQKIVNFTVILVIPSKILGGLIGFLKGWLFIFMGLILLMIPYGSRNMMRESTLTKFILYKTPIVSSYAGKLTSSIKEVFDVTHRVKKKELTSEQANEKCLDIMLKYKMVSKPTVEELMNQGKIENNSSIKAVLEKYNAS